MSKVLIVDDEKSIRITLSEFLTNEGFTAETACDAPTACQMLERGNYDIVITDIIMPKMSGIELVGRIRALSQTMQIIIMTGEPTVETAVKAVQMGANDYLTKPISKSELLKAVRHAGYVKQITDEKLALERQNRIYQKNLEEIVEERTTALHNAMRGMISLLSAVVEFRDPYTAGHQLRVGNLSAAIAEKTGLGSVAAESIRIIGYIHDIGKIAIPAEILSKPGTLSPLELQMIREHPFRGYEMLTKVDLPPIIGNAIYQHHERCDGSGYPRGLSGRDISIEAQIIMVADVVEAMISHRPYRPALGIDAALEEISRNSGKLYNSDIVCACIDLFKNDAYSIEDFEHKIFFTIQ